MRRLVVSGRYLKDPTEELQPTLAAWTKTPRSQLRKKESKKWGTCKHTRERDSVVMNRGKEFLAERWFELFGGR